MIRNTKDLIRYLKISIGGLAFLTVGVISLFITKKMSRRKKYSRNYDPDTVEEIGGKVIEINSAPNDEDAVSGVTIILEDGEITLPIHLGPAWFVNRQFKPFKVGEEVSVNGSRTKFKGEDIIVAETIKRGKVTYRLRDASGSPFWYTKIMEQE